MFLCSQSTGFSEITGLSYFTQRPAPGVLLYGNSTPPLCWATGGNDDTPEYPADKIEPGLSGDENSRNKRDIDCNVTQDLTILR
ncbi:hypothetical protein BgiBS90_012971 [Biomphalaria glabrata]|nr:hypothetical protein BgiBS90_012971 [Biomphalaria glabrata]